MIVAVGLEHDSATFIKPRHDPANQADACFAATLLSQGFMGKSLKKTKTDKTPNPLMICELGRIVLLHENCDLFTARASSRVDSLQLVIALREAAQPEVVRGVEFGRSGHAMQ